MESSEEHIVSASDAQKLSERREKVKDTNYSLTFLYLGTFCAL